MCALCAIYSVPGARFGVAVQVDGKHVHALPHTCCKEANTYAYGASTSGGPRTRPTQKCEEVEDDTFSPPRKHEICGSLPALGMRRGLQCPDVLVQILCTTAAGEMHCDIQAVAHSL